MGRAALLSFRSLNAVQWVERPDFSACSIGLAPLESENASGHASFERGSDMLGSVQLSERFSGPTAGGRSAHDRSTASVRTSNDPHFGTKRRRIVSDASRDVETMTLTRS